VLAIESSAPAPGDTADIAAAQSQFLDSHAHQTVGRTTTYRKGIKLAEKYARWWQRSGATHERCACGDTGLPTPGEIVADVLKSVVGR
jgi:hypothetical protein